MYFLVTITQPMFETLAPRDAVQPATPTLFVIPAVIGFVFMTGFFFLKAFTKFIFAIVNDEPNALTLQIALWTGSAAAFIALAGWLLSRFQKFTVYSLVFLLPLALVAVYLWDKSDYYSRAANANIAYKVVKRPGRLHGRMGPTFLKDVLKVAAFAIWGFATALITSQYELTGFTLLLVQAGFLVLVPTLILGYLTRLTRRLEFASPPRKPRRRALFDTVRLALSGSDETDSS